MPPLILSNWFYKSQLCKNELLQILQYTFFLGPYSSGVFIDSSKIISYTQTHILVIGPYNRFTFAAFIAFAIASCKAKVRPICSVPVAML